MLDRREFAFLLLFAAAIIGAFLWPPAEPQPASSLRATAGFEDADPATDITGFVVDAQGRPVGGAQITSDLHPFGRAPLYVNDWTRPEIDGPQTVTARDGSFILSIGRGEIADLCVRPLEHGEAIVAWRRPGDHLRLTVTAGADLSVTVRDEAGSPARDVRVFILSRQPGDDTVNWHSGVTNEAGLWTYPRLSAAVVTVMAETDEAYGAAIREIPESGSLDVDLTLRTGRPRPKPSEAGVAARGRALRPDGTPLPGARVGTSIDTAWTDRAGRFEIRFGTDPALAVWSPGLGRHVETRGAWTGPMDIKLTPGRSITGSVWNDAGEPAPDVEVILFPGSAEGAETALTDARGTFRFADLAPGQYRLAAQIGSGRPVFREVTVPANEDVTDVALKPGQ